MRVLLVSSIYSPGVGGSSRLLTDIVEHLLEAGHHVEVLAFGASAETAAFDARQSYRIHRVAPRRGSGASSAIMLLKLLALVRRRGSFDLLLAGVAYPSVILTRAASLLRGIPYAVYSHGEDLTCVESRPRARALLSFSLSSAALVMANSNFTRRAALELGASESSVCVHPAIDPEPYERVSQAEVEQLRAKFGLQGKAVIVTLARLAARKGHDNVVRALPAIAARVPNAHYLVVGHGDAEPLRTLARSLGVEERVTFAAYVADEQLPALFSLCDVYTMVSRWDPHTREVEGFGIVFLEAAACGRPSVSGNQGGCPDAVEHEVTGYVVDPEAVPQIEAALLSLLTEPGLAARMGQAGRARVRASFTKSAMLTRVEALLRQAARS